jgi:hypothetical protein
MSEQADVQQSAQQQGQLEGMGEEAAGQQQSA